VNVDAIFDPGTAFFVVVGTCNSVCESTVNIIALCLVAFVTSQEFSSNVRQCIAVIFCH
jgi:hypothetical protein